MGTIKYRNSKDLRKEEIKKRWHEYMEELYKKDLNEWDNHPPTLRARHLGVWSQVGLRNHYYKLFYLPLLILQVSFFIALLWLYPSCPHSLSSSLGEFVLKGSPYLDHLVLSISSTSSKWALPWYFKASWMTVNRHFSACYAFLKHKFSY